MFIQNFSLMKLSYLQLCDATTHVLHHVVARPSCMLSLPTREYLYGLSRSSILSVSIDSVIHIILYRLKKIQEKKKIQRDKAEREKMLKGIKLGKKITLISSLLIPSVNLSLAQHV